MVQPKVHWPLTLLFRFLLYYRRKGKKLLTFLKVFQNLFIVFYMIIEPFIRSFTKGIYSPFKAFEELTQYLCNNIQSFRFFVTNNFVKQRMFYNLIAFMVIMIPFSIDNNFVFQFMHLMHVHIMVMVEMNLNTIDDFFTNHIILHCYQYIE